jgi:hypothetical protein
LEETSQAPPSPREKPKKVDIAAMGGVNLFGGVNLEGGKARTSIGNGSMYYLDLKN